MEFKVERYKNFSERELEENNEIGEAFDEKPQEELAAVEYQESAAPMFRKMICWLIYAVVFFVPFWFLPFTADVSEFNKQALLVVTAGIGLILYLADIIKSGIVRHRPSIFYFPILGLVAASAISAIFSVNRAISLFGFEENRSMALVTVISLAVIFFLAVNVIDDRGKTLKKILTSSLGLAFLFGTLQVFGLHIFKGAALVSKSFNGVGSLNALGILAALAPVLFFLPGFVKNSNKDLPAGLTLPKFGETSWLSRIIEGLRYLGVILAFFLVVVINWWPIWLISFAALLIFVAFTLAGNADLAKNGKVKLFMLPMIVIVLGVSLMLINFNWTLLKSKLPIEVAPSHRSSWRIAFESLKSRPLGFGAENFAIAYDKLKPASIANTIFYQVRFNDSVSEASNMLIEGGILAILAFFALLWVYGKELVGKLKVGFDGSGSKDAASSEPDETGAVWAASSSLLIAYFLYPFNVVAMALLFLLLALITLSTGQDRERVVNLEDDVRYSFLGSLAFIAGLVLVLIAGYFTINNYISNVYIAKALKSDSRKDAIKYLMAGADKNASDARVYRLLSQTILAQLAEDLKNGPQKNENRENYNDKIQNQITSAIDVAVKATNVNPADSQNWMNRGLVYENLLTLVGGADQAAINTYNESLVRNPADPTAYFRIGSVHLALADIVQKAMDNPKNQNIDFAAARKQKNENLARAEDNFKKAVSLYNNFGQALYNLAAVYDRENKLPEAIKQFEKLRAANPRDPSMAFQIGLLYYRNNQKNEAFSAWQQAVLLFPKYSNARWYLSLAYEERGDLNSALKQVEEIEKFNPDNELIKQRLNQLRSGKRTIPPDKVLDQRPLNQ